TRTEKVGRLHRRSRPIAGCGQGNLSILAQRILWKQPVESPVGESARRSDHNAQLENRERHSSDVSGLQMMLAWRKGRRLRSLRPCGTNAQPEAAVRIWAVVLRAFAVLA